MARLKALDGSSVVILPSRVKTVEKLWMDRGLPVHGRTLEIFFAAITAEMSRLHCASAPSILLSLVVACGLARMCLASTTI
jgi:hypothetical protein